MIYPAYTQEEALTRQTFLALMWSLSYPGRVYELPDEGLTTFQAIADTLLDLETSYYCPDEKLSAHLAHTGARSLSADQAAYHFYPDVHDSLLPMIEAASIGTLLYPDQSATLILGCTLGLGMSFELSGPGIPPTSSQFLKVDGIPPAFWEMRTQVNRYPRGWDVYLVSGNQIVGLPRSTEIIRE